ncbi:MAG: EamA family transporter, partial [Lactobacillus crispatus]|nr:EamA family transporter [Lactobacillus crispatus]
NKPEVWLYTAAVIVIGTIIPFQIMANALRYVIPSTVSLLDAFEPFSATVGSVLFFGLVMMPMDWVGSVLVVVAAMALNLTPKQKKNKINH